MSSRPERPYIPTEEQKAYTRMTLRYYARKIYLKETAGMRRRLFLRSRKNIRLKRNGLR